jgi:hydroxymethylpyrimidine/phosphomethylpyrimidine kinase
MVPPCACTIAGSDPSGGAGIQSDLLTFSALNVWGLSVITALTAQDSAGCRGVWPAEPGTVAAQLRAVSGDFEIRAAKTGMLSNAGIIGEVADELSPGIPLVVDPVFASTGGCVLLANDAVPILRERLIPRATLVTPNLDEAAILSGIGSITSHARMEKAGRRIRALGAEYVLVKGGHLPGVSADDILIGPGGAHIMSGSRYPGEFHGTGCCLSAAATAWLARGATVPDACKEARAFVRRAILRAIHGKSGRGMVNPRQVTARDY